MTCRRCGRVAAILSLLWSALGLARTVPAEGEELAACSKLTSVEAVDLWPGVGRRGAAFDVVLRLGYHAGGAVRQTLRVVRVAEDTVGEIKATHGPCATLVLRRVADLLADLELAEEQLEHARRRAERAVSRALAYRLRPGVALTLALERRVADLAERFHRRTRRRLVITSGRRLPLGQAEAMWIKLRLGARVHSLYRNRAALVEVLGAYRRCRRERLTRRETLAAMAATIVRQVDRGVFLSEHLKDNAVDIRVRGLRRRHLRVLERLIRQTPGARAVREGSPPHLHLAFPDGRFVSQ